MDRWEYLTEAVGADDLKARGQEGWRLVSVAAGIMFYERPFVESVIVAAPVVEPVALPPFVPPPAFAPDRPYVMPGVDHAAADAELAREKADRERIAADQEQRARDIEANKSV